jgi:hypothetical protein
MLIDLRPAAEQIASWTGFSPQTVLEWIEQKTLDLALTAIFGVAVAAKMFWSAIRADSSRPDVYRLPVRFVITLRV